VNDARLEPDSVRILQQGDTLRFGKNVSLLLQMRPVTAQEKLLHQQTGVGIAPEVHMAREEVAEVSSTGEMQARPINLAGASQLAQPAARPVFNADGSLALPGAASPVPANVVAALKESPALIMVAHGAPEVFQLKQGKRITLGRERVSDIVLTEMMASRKHAEVYHAPDGYYVRDLGSSNGVMVNQARIDNPYHLTDGDCITVANKTIYFIQQHTGSAKTPLAVPRTVESHPGEFLCRNCGMQMNSAARFCPNCGASANLSMGASV
jgi:pSer/pThr/pTyr-binding forkhead associated (FHA) protein